MIWSNLPLSLSHSPLAHAVPHVRRAEAWGSQLLARYHQGHTSPAMAGFQTLSTDVFQPSTPQARFSASSEDTTQKPVRELPGKPSRFQGYPQASSNLSPSAWSFIASLTRPVLPVVNTQATMRFGVQNPPEGQALPASLAGTAQETALSPQGISASSASMVTEQELAQKLPGSEQESSQQRMIMYQRIEALLPPETKPLLKQLLEAGALNDNKTDFDQKTSALAYLYAIATRPRAYGLKNKVIVNELVTLLAKPDQMNQRFEQLDPQAMQAIQQSMQAPGLSVAGRADAPMPMDMNNLQVAHGATCVPASVMAREAGYSRNPAEFIRHISELTSPLAATYEKAKLSEISPDDPSKALEVLKANNINFVQTAQDEVAVLLRAPKWAYIRAEKAGEQRSPQTRGMVESLYQSTLAYTFTGGSYGPDDLRDNLDGMVVIAQNLQSLTPEQKQEIITRFNTSGGPAKLQKEVWELIDTWQNISPQDKQTLKRALLDRNKGLSPDQKTLMERTVGDDKSFINVNYQVIAPKPNPKPGEETKTYLWGYTRGFEDTTKDLLGSLQRGTPVIIGVMETSPGGVDYNGTRRKSGETYDGNGHEMLVVGAQQNTKTNDLEFILVDTDDGIPHARVESAKSLIPKVNHAGLPYDIGKQVASQTEAIEASGQQLVPDQQDAQAYKLIKTYQG
ncbi:MAG: hypothetical protein ACKO37_07370 [Vampirovibrionales bacterium]